MLKSNTRPWPRHSSYFFITLQCLICSALYAQSPITQNQISSAGTKTYLPVSRPSAAGMDDHTAKGVVTWRWSWHSWRHCWAVA